MKAQVKKAEVNPVQDGLSSKQSYVILARNARLGVHLGLRPRIERMDNSVFLLGGRLRIAFDFDGEDHQTRKPKVADLSKKKSLTLFKKEFPGFQWMTGSEMRCSTTVGIAVAAGGGDSDKFHELWDEYDYVGILMDEIQAKIGRSLTGMQGVPKAKGRANAELVERYEGLMSQIFYSDGGGMKLHESVLGEVSGLLNEGAKRAYSNDRLKFLNKINKLQAKATA